MSAKHTTTQRQVIDSVIEDLSHSPHNLADDLPAIRQALNDRMDYYEREGTLSRHRSDSWSQNKMVAAVRKALGGAR